MTRGRPGVVVLSLFATCALLGNGCGRPLGAVIDGEEPDGSVPADAAVPPPPPCLDLTGLDEAAAWPTFRRCQSRAGCTPNLGPESATVAWSEPIDTELLGVAIGSDGRIYGPSTNPGQASARDPDTGEELVWFGSVDTVAGPRGFPTLGPGGDLWLQYQSMVQLYPVDGSFGVGFGGGPVTVGSPLLQGQYLSRVTGNGTSDGDAELEVTDLVQVQSTDPLADPFASVPLRVVWASAFPSLVGSRVAIVGKRRTELAGPWVWLLLSVAGETVTEPLSSPDPIHDVVVGDGEGRRYLVVDDASGTSSRLIGLDPSHAKVVEVEGLAPLGIAPTLGPDDAVHVVAGGADPPFTLRCLERSGAVRWEALLPGLPLAHPLVDGAGTVYVGGEGYVIAIDAQGAPRWTLLEEGDEELSVQSLALGADRRLIVLTLTRLLAIGP